ncbi:MAG: Protease 4 [Bacteroidota bacterium]
MSQRFKVSVIVGIVLIGAIFGGEENGIDVKENSVIVLNLEDIQNDYAGKYSDPWVTAFSDTKQIGLTDVIDAIGAAKNDENIKGISILNNNSSLGMAQSKAVRDALEDFKKSGKFVMAYANTYSQKEYYLNSVANTIYLNPVGDLDFKGLSSDLLFFKDFQDKTGVKMEVIRHGKYKSAVEPFLENKMSEANREQITALLNSIWNSVVTDIAKSRNVSVEKLNEIANGLLARTPEMAKAQKLVDVVAYEDVYHNAIKKRLQVDSKDEYESVSILDYTHKYTTTSIPNDATDEIAIIYAQGEIQSGEGDVNIIGEGSMRRSISEARNNEDVKAIVLRIDSPGGNALTSDLIWREIELTKKVKPVVVSMGNYAASGGYYIACNADRIMAQPNTITGSIGVFALLPNTQQLFGEKLGLNYETVELGELSAGWRPDRPLGEKERAMMQTMINGIYDDFLNTVAQGRNMSKSHVAALAEGRVYSAIDAKELHLIDDFGGINRAILAAARKSKTKDYRVVSYPEQADWLSQLLNQEEMAKTQWSNAAKASGLPVETIKEAEKIQHLVGPQYLLPWSVKMH